MCHSLCFFCFSSIMTSFLSLFFSFIQLFSLSFIFYFFIHLLIHSFIHLVHSFTYSFIHSFIHLFFLSFFLSFFAVFLSSVFFFFLFFESPKHNKSKKKLRPGGVNLIFIQFALKGRTQLQSRANIGTYILHPPQSLRPRTVENTVKIGQSWEGKKFE